MHKPFSYSLSFVGIAVNYLVAPVRVVYLLITWLLPSVALMIPKFFEVAEVFFNLSFGLIGIIAAVHFIFSLIERNSSYIQNESNKKYFVAGWIYLVMATANLALMQGDVLIDFFKTIRYGLLTLTVIEIILYIVLYRHYHFDKAA